MWKIGAQIWKFTKNDAKIQKKQLNGTLCYDEFFPNIEFVKGKSLKTTHWYYNNFKIEHYIQSKKLK